VCVGACNKICNPISGDCFWTCVGGCIFDPTADVHRKCPASCAQPAGHVLRTASSASCPACPDNHVCLGTCNRICNPISGDCYWTCVGGCIFDPTAASHGQPCCSD
jgi:hypothetical protein